MNCVETPPASSLLPEEEHCDVLVIGSGLAGCTAALALADHGLRVTLLSSGRDMRSGNSDLAQGGIVFSAPEDSPHVLGQDMLRAGAGINYRSALKFLCRQGPATVQELLIDRLRIPFDQAGRHCRLTLEGGHSVARIAYCADYTGKAIMDGLFEAVSGNPNIRMLHGHTAIDLITLHHHAADTAYKFLRTNRCVGAYVLDEEKKRVLPMLAGATVLATGGVGQVFLHTTNAEASIGSGLAMAVRAGARVLHTEFVQFHPTALFHQAKRKFLISEAVRGEGARLVNAVGRRFMEGVHPRAELAPRDVVSRAIVNEMLRSQEACVYLDISGASFDVAARFPTIFSRCRELGIDLRTQPVPVVPAAHYICGGILVDRIGRTTLEGLFAAGECACSGVHGANRLASTSLLEALVWGWSVGRHLGSRPASLKLNGKIRSAIPPWRSPGDTGNEDPALIAQDWATIRHTMWNYVGILRTAPRLQRAHEELRQLTKRLNDFYGRTPISKPLVDLFHGCQAAYTITLAAQRNKTSLGCHFLADTPFPEA